MMRLNLRYWGVAARLAGRSEDSLQLDAGASVDDALAALAAHGAAAPLLAELPRCAFAVDDALVRREHRLHDGAVLDILPPVSGG